MESKNSTVKTLILSGFFAVLGTVVGGVVQGYWTVRLAEQKYQSDLVLKALESTSAQERLLTLKMLVHTNLLTLSGVRDSVSSYIIEKEKDPESIPQVKSVSGQTLDAPIVDNARVYLLTGDKAKTTSFADLGVKLKTAGYTVMNARYIVDPGRKDPPEIRYFNPSDKEQAERLAEFMRFNYDKAYTANMLPDAKAKPGYIEIWLGR
ncbi:hypothetical protein [Mucilaginibacter sp.]|uniref:hypothetical protein n=1 Tax=Mucilaginibacter sp. TaxID=1882438 RepID=UPI003264054C